MTLAHQVRVVLTLSVDRLLHGEQKRVHYTEQDLSAVGGSLDTLREIRRRYHLPDGTPSSCASSLPRARTMPMPRAIQKASTRRLSTSQHSRLALPPPGPKLSQLSPTSTSRSTWNESAAHELTLTMPEPMVQTQQRLDTKKWRAQASDTEMRVRTKRQHTGITSTSFMLPGADEVSDDNGERAAKRQRQKDDFALEDRITDPNFKLTRTFSSELSDDPIEDALDSERETGRVGRVDRLGFALD